MVRLLLGLVKGAIIGAAAGYGAWYLGLTGGWGYLVFGAVGFLVGLLVGKPFWAHLVDKESTVVTSLLKGIVGFGIGAGLFALVRHVLGDPALSIAGLEGPMSALPHLTGGVIGALYGAFVEVDDAPAANAKAKPAAKR